ncbi:MAG TPA: isocitrate lyase/phosphoenolpyruvate mutase family protein [Jatrophihabitantaceae bacterium]|nr:isocitrate lyase/phosphoenolpyruvate mutase family protein [Jatrophihabitantaceae bacterium]
MPPDLRARFHQLHRRDLFVMPNPWDVGSARRLAELGFHALATTSSGLAWSLGKEDQQVTRGELLVHVAALTGVLTVPLNVDAERCYADDLAGVEHTVELVAAAGAAGISIEDYDPATGSIDELPKATERVAAAATAAKRTGLVLTARAENHLYGRSDLADTIERLTAYRAAGADVVYAPGLVDLDDIHRIVTEVGGPVNVLRLPNGPSLEELAAAGVRRVSTGGALARTAYAAMAEAASQLPVAVPAQK